uniref:Uncharacterized protein n=1 Tax=Arundo donax TaxID=35708 RepID=A0A0A9HAV5_ARUDO
MVTRCCGSWGGGSTARCSKASGPGATRGASLRSSSP